MAEKKKFDWSHVWTVGYTILGCIIVGSLVVFYLVSVNNAHVRGIKEGYSQAAAEINAK